MDSIVDTFSHLCLEKFHFLVTEFACKRAVRKETAGVYRVIFRNHCGRDWTGVERAIHLCRGLPAGRWKDGRESDSDPSGKRPYRFQP